MIRKVELIKENYQAAATFCVDICVAVDFFSYQCSYPRIVIFLGKCSELDEKVKVFLIISHLCLSATNYPSISETAGLTTFAASVAIYG